MPSERAESERSGDFFLKNRPNEPKKEIADYVEEQGFKVPARFSDLDNAMAFISNGGTIIVRSEHPQDYAGVSGLLESYSIDKGSIAAAIANTRDKDTSIDWNMYSPGVGGYNPFSDVLTRDNIFERLLVGIAQSKVPSAEFLNALKKLDEHKIEEHCAITGQNADQFTAQVSYSFWEKIDGFNRSIIEDSAIPGRHFIFTHWTQSDDPLGHREKFNATIMEDGHRVQSFASPLTAEAQQSIPDLIAEYEKIRKLRKFAPRQCPIMEFQSNHAGQNYFLQYLRTRDAESANFSLTRALEPDEFQADFVRGVTPPEGTVVHSALYYPDEYAAPRTESAGFTVGNHGTVFEEVMAPRRQAAIGIENINRLAATMLSGHVLKSSMFKPKIFVSSSRLRGIVSDLAKDLHEQTEKNNSPARIAMHIVSDGRKAYIKLLDPRSRTSIS